MWCSRSCLTWKDKMNACRLNSNLVDLLQKLERGNNRLFPDGILVTTRQAQVSVNNRLVR